MTIYIVFLLGVFVAGGVSPRLIKHPAFLLFLCLMLCFFLYTGRGM